jgi:recombination protein RecT
VADTYLALLEAKEENIKKVLPEWLTFDRFMTLARALEQNPDLRQCSPQSLVGCVLDAANRGWEVGGPSKHCAIVKFKSTAVLIPQWQGRAFLWMRAGAITKLRANVAYTWDAFDWDEGQEVLTHKQDLDADHSWQQLNDIKNIKAAYAIATLPNGDKQYSVVSHAQLVRTMESVKRKNNGALGFGWTDWLPEMCRKTAVHRLDGFLQAPASADKLQQSAWDRSHIGSDGEVSTEDLERMKRAEQANADIDNPPRKVTAEVDGKKSDADQELSGEEEDALVALLKKAGVKASQMDKWVEEHCFEDLSISTLAEVKKGMMTAITAKIGA